MQYNSDANQNANQQNPAAFQQEEERRISTNTPDKHYDLISVLYHALEGAQTYAQYAEDAGRAGDKELAQFFLQVQQQQISDLYPFAFFCDAAFLVLPFIFHKLSLSPLVYLLFFLFHSTFALALASS